MPLDSSFVSQFMSEAQMIEKRVQNIVKQNKRDNVQTIFNICSNILKFPKDPKYRTIKRSNPKLAKIMEETPDVLYLLQQAGFKLGDELIEFPGDGNFQLLKDTSDRILNAMNNLFTAPMQQPLLQQQQQQFNPWSDSSSQSQQQSSNNTDINNITYQWQLYLQKGDEFRSQTQLTDAIYWYSQSFELVKPFATASWMYRTNLLCAHSMEQLANIYVNAMHDQAKGMAHYEQAAVYCEPLLPANWSASMPAFKAQLMAMVFFGYGSCILLCNSINYTKAFQMLDLAWKCSTHCNDEGSMAFKVAHMCLGCMTNLNKPDQVDHWLQIIKDLQTKYPKQKQGNVGFLHRMMEVERNINMQTAREQLDLLIALAMEAESVDPEFAASVFGQVIYHHRRFASPSNGVSLEEGIQYGERALAILQPKYGEKHGVIRNVYLSLSDTYQRLGNAEKAQEFKKKMEYAHQLVGM